MVQSVCEMAGFFESKGAETEITPAEKVHSILESQIAPAMDDIIAEYGHLLRSSHHTAIQRCLSIVEEIIYQLEQVEDEA
jgi:hypothetical protein